MPLAALIGAGIAVYSGRWIEIILAAIVVGAGLFAYAYFRGGLPPTGGAAREDQAAADTGDQQDNR